MLGNSDNHGPQARRISLFRRVATLALLAVSCAVIGAYWLITDPERVRAVAMRELSHLLHARVEIDDARLSLFDGLLLRGVRVWAGGRTGESARIFDAVEVQIGFDIRAILSGRIEPSSIVAMAPRIRLCEDADSGAWNFQGPRQRAGEKRRYPRLTLPTNLPRLVLRGGALEYGRVQGGRYECVGTMAVDGRLAPLRTDPRLVPEGAHAYAFDLHSRAPGQSAGPHLRGVLDLGGTSISARLEDVSVDENSRRMFPAQVQRWWSDHQLAGRLRVPRLTYVLRGPDSPGYFSIEIELQSVRLLVLPQELMGERQYARSRIMRPGFIFTEAPGLDLVRRTEAFDLVARPAPLQVSNVSGRIVFTSEGIRFHGLTGRIENNIVTGDGHVDGYDPDAPFWLRIVACNALIPYRPRCLPSLPREVQSEYRRFQPVGRANLTLTVSRPERRGRIEAQARLTALSGGFCFADFAYPLRDVRGVIHYYRDQRTGMERIDIDDLAGRGILGTPNENCQVRVEGWVSPLGRRSEVDIRVSGRRVHLDDHLREALPHAAKEALNSFYRLENGQRLPVQVFGDFEAHVTREYGEKKPTEVAVDLDIHHARGAYDGFPYPLDEVRGKLLVRPDHVELRGIRGETASMTCAIDGRVWFPRGEPVRPDLRISVRSLPVDQRLAAAVSDEGRQLLRAAGLSGIFDVEGPIFLGRSSAGEPVVDYDLKVNLRDGRAWAHPAAGHVIDSLVAEGHLTRDRLTVASAQGRFIEAPVTGQGVMEFSGGGTPRIDARVDIEDLAATPRVRALLPPEARKLWDQLRVEGKAGLSMGLSNRQPGGWRNLSQRIASPRAAVAATMPATRPFFEVVVLPRGMSICPAAFPWRIDGIEGEVIVSHDGASIPRLSGRHGGSTLSLSGSSDGVSRWNARIGARDVMLDDELRKALPPQLASLFGSIGLAGTFSTGNAEIAYSASEKGTRLELSANVLIAGGRLDAGVQLTDIAGQSTIAAVLRDGDLETLAQTLSITSARWGGRAVSDLRCHISRKPGEPVYRISDLRARLCGGIVAADIDIGSPGGRSTRYGMRLAMRDVDVRQLVGDPDYRPQGRLTANLDMQGKWEDPLSRQGRGYVEVEGRDLYRVPVLLGDMQVGDVAMPVNKPFQQASVRYSFAGHRTSREGALIVYLEQVELRAPGLLMRGSGTIDLGTRTVQMEFSTDAPQWYGLPVLGPFLKGPGRELLRVRVAGAVNDLKVEGRPLGVFITTINRVLDAGGKK